VALGKQRQHFTHKNSVLKKDMLELQSRNFYH